MSWIGRHSGATPLFSALLTMVVAACAPTGDFGRAPPSFYNDTAMPFIGKVNGLVREEPVTFLPLTDNETELRARAYTLVVARDILGEAQSTKPYLRFHNVLRPWPETTPVNAYHDRILRQKYATSEGRFTRIMADMQKDLAAIEPFRQSAGAVARDDALRRKILNGEDPLAARTIAGAEARMYDNDRITGLVVATLVHRIDIYAYALRHLAAETPTQRIDALEAAYHDYYQSVKRLERRFADALAFAGATKDGEPIVLSGDFTPPQTSGAQPYSLARPR